jgi:hypothetical protein
VKPNLTDYAYQLLRIKRPGPAPKSQTITQRDRIPQEPQCCGGDDFTRFQNRYHGIPEHLIEANDHD